MAVSVVMDVLVRSATSDPVFIVAENLILPPSEFASPFNVRLVQKQSLKARSLPDAGDLYTTLNNCCPV